VITREWSYVAGVIADCDSVTYVIMQIFSH
jgi:hypothetical protein